MAKEIGPSIEIPYDWKASHEETQRAYEEAVQQAAEEARAKAKGDLVGETLQFGVADGYAVYMVVKQKPLTFRHVNWLDGYRVHAALIRGLRVTDVRKQIEAERRMRELFSRKAAR